MEEVIKKINGNLIEIKSNQNKDTFHISGGTGNIGQQNNYFSQNIIKPLKDYKEKIPIKNISFIQRQKDFIFFVMIFVLCFIPGNQVFFKLDSGQFFMILFSSIISFGVLFFLYNIVVNKKYEAFVLIENEKLIFKYFEKNKNKDMYLEYKDIRTTLRNRYFTIFGFEYVFYVYVENQIKPYIKFSDSSIHSIIAIEELIKYNGTRNGT